MVDPSGEAIDQGAGGAPSRSTDRVALVMIIPDPQVLDVIVTALVDLGVAATIIESKGLMTLLREEMPIFGGLTAMLPQTSGGKVILSVATAEVSGKVMDFIEEKMKKGQRPIAFTLPIGELIGLRQ